MSLVLPLVFSACESGGSGGSGGGDPCAALETSLRVCDLLTEGTFSCETMDDCSVQCSTGLECGELAATSCGEEATTDAFSTCYEDCAYFQCGDGETVDKDWQCDDMEDCANGADEVGCSQGDSGDEIDCSNGFSSGNGGVSSGSNCSQAAKKLQGCGMLSSGANLAGCEAPDSDEEACYSGCVMATSCADLYAMVCGEDEDEDPSQTLITCFEACQSAHSFDCASGDETVPEGWVCDGMDDCGDGSDEVGCAGVTGGFACASGDTTVYETWVCDGMDDCGDGSDELGCATLICE